MPAPTRRPLFSSGDDTSGTQAPMTYSPQTNCLDCVGLTCTQNGVPSSRKKKKRLELELNTMTGHTAAIRHRAQPSKRTDQQILFRQLTLFVPLSSPLFSLAHSSSNSLASSFSTAFVPALRIPQQVLYNPKMLFFCLPVPQVGSDTPLVVRCSTESFLLTSWFHVWTMGLIPLLCPT